MEKKILLFDTTRGFYRFLKIHFFKQYTITLCRDKEEVGSLNFEDYNIVIVVVNSVDEFIELHSIKRKVSKLIVCYKSTSIGKNVDKIEGVLKLDFRKVRSEFLIDLNKYLTELNIK